MAGTSLLGEGSIGLMCVVCYCGLLTAQFVFGDRIRVDLLLKTLKLPFQVVGDQYRYGGCLIWMQTGSGGRVRNANWGEMASIISS